MKQGNGQKRSSDGDSVRMQRLFARDFAALEGIFAFVTEFGAASRIGADRSFEVQLMVEEIFTNMVKYNKDGSVDIDIELRRDGDRLQICLIDADVEPFDITKLPEVDTVRHLAEEKVGGLGLHLVKKIADDISYEYVGRLSKVTITKRVGS